MRSVGRTLPDPFLALVLKRGQKKKTRVLTSRSQCRGKKDLRVIDIFPGLFLWLLFTYPPLFFLWFLFTTAEPWSLACCLKEFPSYVIVYFQANYFEIG